MDADWIRNRRLLAERLAWPDGALAVAERLEEMYPRYAVSWDTGMPSEPQPGYYAYHRADSRGDPLFGATPDDLIATLDADMARRAKLPSYCQ